MIFICLHCGNSITIDVFVYHWYFEYSGVTSLIMDRSAPALSEQPVTGEETGMFLQCSHKQVQMCFIRVKL